MDVKSYWVRARSKPPAVGARVVRVAWCDRRLHADDCRAAGADGRAGTHAAAGTAARRRHPVAAGGASWSAGRSGSTRASGRQPQPRRIERRTRSRHRARNNAGTDTSRPVAASASFAAPRPKLTALASGDARAVASATGPVLALLEKARAQLEGDVALGLTFQGSYSQTKPKEPAYGGHASAMGPAPANIPSPEDGAPVPVTFEVGARLPDEDVLRRTDQGPHPRIGLRRRRPVRLRRRWTARHLSGDRGGAHAGA